MDKVVVMQSNRSAKGFNIVVILNRLGGSVNNSAKEAYMMDSDVLAWSGIM